MRTILGAAVLAAVPGLAAAEIIERTSPHSVADTADRLESAVEGAGATVFARVDHGAGAESVGEELLPNVMVMFGNPALGTPAMQAAPSAGLDLPLRVVIFEAGDGTVTLAYHDPAELADDHGIPADAAVLEQMRGALAKLTEAAVAP